MPSPWIPSAGDDLNPSPMAMSNQKVDDIKILEILASECRSHFAAQIAAGPPAKYLASLGEI
jgi:hypothetical protein